VRRGTAFAAALVGLAGEGLAVALAEPGDPRWNELAIAAVVAAYAVVGLLLAWYRQAPRIARVVLLMVAVWGPGQALVAFSTRRLVTAPGDRVAALCSTVGSTARGLPWLVLVLWLPLLFPDGRLPDEPLYRRCARLATVTVAAFSFESLLSPRLTDLRFDRIDNPIGLPHSLAGAMGALAGIDLLLGGASLVGVVLCLTHRYRRGSSLSRQQVVVFGSAFLAPTAALAASSFDAAGPWLFGLSTLPLPLALGVAMLQRRLYDVPLAVNRSITYGTLWLLIALLYAVTVGGVGAVVGDHGAPWLPWAAAGIVAVSFAPLRTALQLGANRLTYGQWASPDQIRARTSDRLAAAEDLGGLLTFLADELTEGLSLGFLEITDRDGRVLAVSGAAAGETDELALTTYGAQVGRMRWARRPLRPADRALLAELAGRLGEVVHTGELVGSLRSAQERLVLAREEERRRLRRDLHDGLGPTLAALGLKVDTLRNVAAVGEDPEHGLLELRTAIQSTVGDVRRIVDGLRPPALADLGLADAVRQLAETSTVPATVHANGLPRLPAAVEVAAYRIVQEALTNAGRHSGAAVVEVSLAVANGTLDLQIRDDGTGEVAPRPDGVGLLSMRERAEEIGGTFSLRAVPGSGTQVHVELPTGSEAGRG
jgi:signal transduction histidine kinase